jgi:hypothetical protein
MKHLITAKASVRLRLMSTRQGANSQNAEETERLVEDYRATYLIRSSFCIPLRSNGLPQITESKVEEMEMNQNAK